LTDRPKLRVAMLGMRGIPARYGGAETAAAEIYPRLAARGHEAVVYCRRHKVDPGQKWFRGVRTVVLPSIHTKSLDTITASILGLFDVVIHNRADIVHFIGIGNAMLFPWFRLFGKTVVVIVDGMDWKRTKWNRPERAYLRLALWMAVHWANTVYVDSREAQRLCLKLYGREFPYIAYGAQIDRGKGTKTLEKHGLEPEKYLLFVGRLIPEKGVHFLIDAFAKVKTDLKLAIVGDNPYHPKYVQQLRTHADERVLFLGTEYGEGFWELCANCYAYVQPSEVEGTSPVLLSAMGCARCVIVNGIPENRDTIGDAGIAFEMNNVDHLAEILRNIIDHPELVKALGLAAQERVRKHFDWDRITQQHEDLFYTALASKTRRRT
jgi:glycosyltransferase involved in cell wall biosynthesis